MSDYTDADYEADMADADSREERRQRSYSAWLRGQDGVPLDDDALREALGDEK